MSGYALLANPTYDLAGNSRGFAGSIDYNACTAQRVRLRCTVHRRQAKPDIDHAWIA
ncbi:MAG: hypothetical protein AW09_004655 [Candidatus Accumulibacter phosphatis]|uniref:Uncharacterized protein n=1 Tax=Candidatus Accumulibacter phosphatis TaxID=327160 RepID=A0A084Y6A8_9PROT|nr:MAG: hypothetical protein AW09_004655 [Candidatus Accumulibacter phosphatis]